MPYLSAVNSSSERMNLFVYTHWTEGNSFETEGVEGPYLESFSVTFFIVTTQVGFNAEGLTHLFLCNIFVAYSCAISITNSKMLLDLTQQCFGLG